MKAAIAVNSVNSFKKPGIWPLSMTDLHDTTCTEAMVSDGEESSRIIPYGAASPTRDT
jgi:hypothetical protein